jgi:hypothetical protein
VPADEDPTAIQAEAELQETPLSHDLVAPVGSGVGSIVHATPFHLSASVFHVAFGPDDPTATQSVFDTHEMALS